jgi:hypothetical protein
VVVVGPLASLNEAALVSVPAGVLDGWARLHGALRFRRRMARCFFLSMTVEVL